MAKDQVEWVSLEDVMLAAQRGVAPLGPEVAGYIALESAARLREMGEGVVDATGLAIGTGGHVALTAEPRRGSEQTATRALRATLGALLDVTTSATPSLRQCARRKDHATLTAFTRELEGALVPLNRAASRRAVARIARATLEAIEDGRLDGLAEDVVTRRDDSDDPPAVALGARPPSDPPALPRTASAARAEREDAKASTIGYAPIAHTPPPVSSAPPLVAEEPTPPSASEAPVARVSDDAEPTPFQPPVFDEPSAGSQLSALAAAIDDQGPADIEIVSHLPPIVTSVPPTVVALNDRSPHGSVYAIAFRPRSEGAQAQDRVASLIERFEVSRRRDDQTLGRELKGWVGIETAQPPPVHTAQDVASDRPSEPAVLRDSAEPVSVSHERAGSRASSALFVALGALSIAAGVLVARPALLDRVLSPTAGTPSGPQAAHAPATSPTVVAPKLPLACEASLTLEGTPAGSEVLRRVGVTPFAVSVPTNVALDLVATMEGHAPRRAHVDATALWKKDATGDRLDVPFALDAAASPKWPGNTGVSALRAPSDAPRGLLRGTSTPNGASVWIVVDPAAVTGVPCGVPVDLLVVPSGAAPKPLRVEWSAFTGSPPRASAKW